MNISQMMAKVLHTKRYRVKTYIRVKPRYKRDSNGRFVGGLIRKGYTRRIFDRQAPKVSGIELMAENITANNALLTRLKSKAIIT